MRCAVGVVIYLPWAPAGMEWQWFFVFNLILGNFRFEAIAIFSVHVFAAGRSAILMQ